MSQRLLYRKRLLDLFRTVNISNDSNTLCTTIKLVLPVYPKERYTAIVVAITLSS